MTVFAFSREHPARIWTARLVVLAALAAYPLIVNEYPRTLVTEIFIYGIFAMSLDLLFGFTGLMSFGHAAFFGLGAYTTVILGVQFGISAWLGILAGILAASFGALAVGFFCTQTSGVTFLMLTLAFSQLFFSAAVKWRDVTGGSDGISLGEKPTLFGISLYDPFAMYYTVLCCFVLSYVVLHRIVASPLGHVFIGIRENEPRMRAIGFRTRVFKVLSFSIGGAFAGLAGGIYAIYNDFISPDALYWTSSGDILIVVILGGAGTLVGPVIGTAVFLLMKNLVSSHSEHWMLIIGVIFISCVMFFPRGIWGTLARLWPRRQAPAPGSTAVRSAIGRGRF